MRVITDQHAYTAPEQKPLWDARCPFSGHQPTFGLGLKGIQRAVKPEIYHDVGLEHDDGLPERRPRRNSDWENLLAYIDLELQEQERQEQSEKGHFFQDDAVARTIGTRRGRSYSDDMDGYYEPEHKRVKRAPAPVRPYIQWKPHQEIVPRVQSAGRRGPRGQSMFKGVCITRAGKWRSVIYIGRKQKYLGVYDTEVEAAHAYDTSAIKHFGAGAKLNFPQNAAALQAAVSALSEDESDHTPVFRSPPRTRVLHRVGSGISAE